MSNSKRTFLRGLLFGILSIVPMAGLAVTTSAGTQMPDSSLHMNQTTPGSTPQQSDQMIMSSSSTVVETPVGGAGVDVPGVNPDIDMNTNTPITPDVDIGVSLTSDGTSGMTMHQNSNGITEAPSSIAPPGEGENGIPVQPVPNSPPGGTISNQAPMAPNGGFGAKVQHAVLVAESNQGDVGSENAVGVSVDPTYYRGGGGHYYRGQVYYSNRGGYYYSGPHYYGHQPYDYYYPYRGYAYYPYQDYYQYYNYNWGW